MTPESADRSSDVLGHYIRAQRQLADLSLRQLADMSNVSNAYLSQIERGLHQPSLRILRAIADALDLPSETLLSEAGLIDQERSQSPPASETEAAILDDRHLTGEDKHVLLRVYRTLRAGKETIREERPEG